MDNYKILSDFFKHYGRLPKNKKELAIFVLFSKSIISIFFLKKNKHPLALAIASVFTNYSLAKLLYPYFF